MGGMNARARVSMVAGWVAAGVVAGAMLIGGGAGRAENMAPTSATPQASPTPQPSSPPQPSPSTGRLLYSHLTDGTWQIWQVDLATGAQAPVTRSPRDKRHAAWAPDGAVSYCTSNQGCFELRPGQPERALLEQLWPMRDLAASPDGQRVVFSKFRTDIIDQANLWIAGRDGADARQLTTDPGMQYAPRWSPDGARLAYTAGHGYGTYDIHVIGADGSGARPVTTLAGHEFFPAWSPDGRRLAFSADGTGDPEIWTVNADGSGLAQLTRSPGLDTAPAWSPDGRAIAFTTNRSGALQVWVMAADGRGQRRLDPIPADSCDPAWSR